jgi:PAS domain S-box-containing protein/putative nucleotidyltransferase with HDIG domain
VSPARRARLIPVIEISLAVLATALAFYFGERFSIATYLGMVSRRAHVGVDFANLGPGLFVLASGLGVVTVRRWRETITERETLSETRSVLANSEMQYRALVELSPAPMLLSNQDLVVIFANDAARRLMRASEGNRLEGHCFLDLVHPDSLARVKFRGMSVLDGQAMPSEEVRLVRLDGTGVTVQISSVPASMEGRPGIQSVLQDVTHLAEIADTLRQATVDTVEAMARLAEVRDPYTSGHQSRVAKLALLMAREMALPDETAQAVHIAGIVHDIGKINVPVEILSKPGKLTEAEFDLIKTHAERGYEILSPIEFPWPIAEIVRQHHERLDGSGYPRGISDGDILLESRILAVADTVEAVGSNRPYRPALGLEAAFRIIDEGRGTIYDAACVDACKAVASQVITQG